jgi:hypothetical protein
MLQALKSKQTDKSLNQRLCNMLYALKLKQKGLNDECLCKCYMHWMKSKQTDKSLNDECLCKCYMDWNRNKPIRAWMNVYVNATCTEIGTKQKNRAWINDYVNVTSTEIETNRWELEWWMFM